MATAVADFVRRECGVMPRDCFRRRQISRALDASLSPVDCWGRSPIEGLEVGDPDRFPHGLIMNGKLTGHTGCVNAICWSGNGELLASSGDDRQLCLWRYPVPLLEKRAFHYEVKRRHDNRDFVGNWADQDDVLVARFDTNHTANVFSIQFLEEKGPAVRDYREGMAWQRAVADKIATCAGDRTARLFQVGGPGGDATELQVWRCCRDRVKKLSAVDEGRVLLACSEDGTVRQWDVRERHECEGPCGMSILVEPAGGVRPAPGPFAFLAGSSRRELNSIDAHPLLPHCFVVGGATPFVREHDRRMPAEPLQRFCPLHLRRLARGGAGHITGVRYSWDGSEILATYSGDHIYSFRRLGSLPVPPPPPPPPPPADAAEAEVEEDGDDGDDADGDAAVDGSARRMPSDGCEGMEAAEEDEKDEGHAMEEIVEAIVDDDSDESNVEEENVDNDSDEAKLANVDNDSDSDEANVDNDSDDDSDESSDAIGPRLPESDDDDDDSDSDDSSEEGLGPDYPDDDDSDSDEEEEEAMLLHRILARLVRARNAGIDIDRLLGGGGGGGGEDDAEEDDAPQEEDHERWHLPKGAVPLREAAERFGMDEAADDSPSREDGVYLEAREAANNILTWNDLSAVRKQCCARFLRRLKDEAPWLPVRLEDLAELERLAASEGPRDGDGTDVGEGRGGGNCNDDDDDGRSPLGEEAAAEEEEEEEREGYFQGVYFGHVNFRTVKSVNFWGPRSEYVVSGSDCGRVFVWHRESQRLAAVFPAERSIVNVLEGHPFLPVLATAGIEHCVRLWVPPLHGGLPACAPYSEYTEDENGRPVFEPRLPQPFLRLFPNATHSARAIIRDYSDLDRRHSGTELHTVATNMNRLANSQFR